jgi:hypothetical protein
VFATPASALAEYFLTNSQSQTYLRELEGEGVMQKNLRHQQHPHLEQEYVEHLQDL